MSQIDGSAVVAVSGRIFVAPTGTAKPVTVTDPDNPGAEWESIGHTSRETLPEFTRDGDEPTTLGSWENSKLTVVSPDVTYGVNVSSVQCTTSTYEIYFGAGPGATQADGSFRIPATPTAQEKALLVLLVQGPVYVPLWHPRVSLLGSDAIALSVEQFVTFPLHGTFLSHDSIGGAIGEWHSILA